MAINLHGFFTGESHFLPSLALFSVYNILNGALVCFVCSDMLEDASSTGAYFARNVAQGPL